MVGKQPSSQRTPAKISPHDDTQPSVLGDVIPPPYDTQLSFVGGVIPPPGNTQPSVLGDGIQSTQPFNFQPLHLVSADITPATSCAPSLQSVIAGSVVRNEPVSISSTKDLSTHISPTGSSTG